MVCCVINTPVHYGVLPPSVSMLTSRSTTEGAASDPNPVEYPSIDTDNYKYYAKLYIQQTTYINIDNGYSRL